MDDFLGTHHGTNVDRRRGDYIWFCQSESRLFESDVDIIKMTLSEDDKCQHLQMVFKIKLRWLQAEKLDTEWKKLPFHNYDSVSVTHNRILQVMPTTLHSPFVCLLFMTVNNSRFRGWKHWGSNLFMVSWTCLPGATYFSHVYNIPENLIRIEEDPGQYM